MLWIRGLLAQLLRQIRQTRVLALAQSREKWNNVCKFSVIFSEGRALHVCSFVFSLRFGALDFGIYLIFEVGRDLQIVFFWFLV